MHFEGILKVFGHNFEADLVELGMVGMVQSLVDGLQFRWVNNPAKKNPDFLWSVPPQGSAYAELSI